METLKSILIAQSIHILQFTEIGCAVRVFFFMELFRKIPGKEGILGAEFTKQEYLFYLAYLVYFTQARTNKIVFRGKVVRNLEGIGNILGRDKRNINDFVKECMSKKYIIKIDGEYYINPLFVNYMITGMNIKILFNAVHNIDNTTID